MQRIPFDDSYRAPYPQVSRAVRYGDLIFTSGQLDVDGQGRLQHEGDLAAETRRSMSLLYDAIRQAGGGSEDLAHLQVFYRDDGQVDETNYRRDLVSLLPENCRPVVVLTPIETFPKGIQVEVDAIARVGSVVKRVERAGVCAQRAGDLIFLQADIDGGVNGVAGVFDDIALCLDNLGGTLGDVVKLRYYAGSLTSRPSDTEWRVLERFPSPGPVYTRLPLAGTSARAHANQIELIAVIADHEKSAVRHLLPSDHGSCPWGLENPIALARSSYVFVGGQLCVDSSGAVQHPGLIRAQIDTVMNRLRAILASFDLHLGAVAKVNAYHQGREDKATWTENVQLRANYYPSPGPASTGVEVPTVGMEGALITLDCVALGNAF